MALTYKIEIDEMTKEKFFMPSIKWHAKES